MKNTLAFSLIEVLVFVTILALFFVAAAAVTTISLRDMKINEHKILATRYGEELLEWLRSQKEIDWNQFVNQHSGGSAKKYCFNLSPISGWPVEGSCGPTQLINSFYKREVTISNQSTPPVLQTSISITVTWNEPSGLYSFPINSIFSIWEQ